MFLAAGLAVWAGALAASFGWQTRYANEPGVPAVAGMHWPGGASVPLDPEHFNLMLFLHPQCSCSRATLSELEHLTADAGPGLHTRVWVVRYAGDAPLATASPLFAQAASIRGVTVTEDPDGQIARQFGAACSGQTLLYSRTGRLLFSGGITGSRGHVGGNAGESVVLAMVRAGGTVAPLAKTPVYGCALFDTAASVSAGVTARTPLSSPASSATEGACPR